MRLSTMVVRYIIIIEYLSFMLIPLLFSSCGSNAVCSNMHDSDFSEYRFESDTAENWRHTNMLVSRNTGKILFKPSDWIDTNSSVTYWFFNEHIVIVTVIDKVLLGFPIIDEHYDYRKPDFPRNTIFVIDICDKDKMYTADLKSSVLTGIESGYVLCQDPRSGDEQEIAMELVSSE